MSLILSDEQTMLRDNTRGFLTRNAPITHLRQLRDSHDPCGLSRDLWKELAAMGLAGILAPERFGGSGLGHVEAGIVMEELGHTLTPSPFLSTAVLGASAIAHAGDDHQKKEFLPGIVAGDLIVALAVDETAKHHPDRIALRAARAGGGFVLNGKKTFVVDGHVADLLIVAARTSEQPGSTGGITLFLVDPKTKGISVERTQMTDAHNAARVAFDSVNVGADAVLGAADDGWSALEAALNAGRAALAAEMVGIGDEAFSRTVIYLKERKQFGRPIGEFQALQHRAADLYCEIEVTRSSVLKALQMLDSAPATAGPAVAMAKARAGVSVTQAVQEGVQMHGGIGMTDEFDMGLFMKRARVCNELLGDSNFHADRIARLNHY